MGCVKTQLLDAKHSDVDLLNFSVMLSAGRKARRGFMEKEQHKYYTRGFNDGKAARNHEVDNLIGQVKGLKMRVDELTKDNGDLIAALADVTEDFTALIQAVEIFRAAESIETSGALQDEVQLHGALPRAVSLLESLKHEQEPDQKV